MESVTKQLVKAGHELAVQLSNQLGMIDTASLVQRLTAQLDITAVALQEMTRKRDAEHGDVLTWEKTMFKVCGEDGHKSVAAKFADLEAKCAALAAENAWLKAAIDATIGWQQSTDPENVESVRMLVDIKTPATEAFLAEVRAQGVDMFGQCHNFSEKLFIQKETKKFAAQLRQDANTAELLAAGIITKAGE